MALEISTVTVTGTATAYTVPSDKIAKVRITSIGALYDSAIISIGKFTCKNESGATCYSEKGTSAGTTTTNFGTPCVLGFLRCVPNANWDDDCLFVKEDHILVEGETVSNSHSSAVMSYTIFEEDA